MGIDHLSIRKEVGTDISIAVPEYSTKTFSVEGNILALIGSGFSFTTTVSIEPWSQDYNGSQVSSAWLLIHAKNFPHILPAKMTAHDLETPSHPFVVAPTAVGPIWHKPLSFWHQCAEFHMPAHMKCQEGQLNQ